MRRKTSLASGVDVAKKKAAYDAACKRLLSEKIILAWILKSCTTEFRDLDVNTIAKQCIEGKPYVSKVPVGPDETAPAIQGMNTAHTSPTEGNVYFDIYFRAVVPKTGEVIQLIINVEIQGDFHPGYPLPKRGIFYCGRMISSQAGFVFESSEYGKLRKVYSIWICPNPPKRRENSITRYHMAEECVVGSDHEPKENYDLISLVMIHLGAPEGQESDSLLKLPGTLLSSDTSPAAKKQVLEEEFHIPMTKAMDREVSALCNLSDYIEYRGIQKGEQKGMEKGTFIALNNLMKNTGWPFEKAISTLDVPQEQWKIYADMLISTAQ